MRLLLEAHHPAHIHFFKHSIQQWLQRGDDVLLVGRDRDVMQQLLTAYDYIPSVIATRAGKNNRFPLQEMLLRQLQVARHVRRFQPDAVLSLMGSYCQFARVLGVPNLIFTDSEFQHFNHRIAHPFATRIFTPECFYKDLGHKQVKYKGYHELAFLHPARFTPDPSVLSEMGVEAGKYVIVRVSAWDTLHDVGQSGFGAALDEFLELLLQQHQVRLVPEKGKLNPKWEHLRLKLPPHRFHDALAFAKFVVSEGASTAAEAACLGVPAVYLNSTTRGYLDDMAANYNLVSSHTQARTALLKVNEWLKIPPDLPTLKAARDQLIADHVDVTQFVVDSVDSLIQ